jgi:hypothetical protein
VSCGLLPGEPLACLVLGELLDKLMDKLLDGLLGEW